MSLSRKNPKRDQNEKAIVEALALVGVQVWRLSGTGLPDLLTKCRGVWLPLEVKGPKGRLTPAQVGIQWPVVRNEAEALQAVGVVLK